VWVENLGKKSGRSSFGLVHNEVREENRGSGCVFHLGLTKTNPQIKDKKEEEKE
jgi:hypothetical protein